RGRYFQRNDNFCHVQKLSSRLLEQAPSQLSQPCKLNVLQAIRCRWYVKGVTYIHKEDRVKGNCLRRGRKGVVGRHLGMVGGSVKVLGIFDAPGNTRPDRPGCDGGLSSHHSPRTNDERPTTQSQRN